MSNEALGVVVIFGLLALWEIDHIRRDAARMCVMMEADRATSREMCREVTAISQMLAKEIADEHKRRLRDMLG